MHRTMKKAQKKRILWVDIAKALTILSVPISHCLELDSMLRVAIFSFHMPLFFILSGFTTKPATDFKVLKNRTIKNFKYLILPSLAVLIVFAITEAIKFGGLQLLPEKILWTFREFFINLYPEGLYNASAVWFLIALFLAKLEIDLINIFFKTDKNAILIFLLGTLGIAMGVFEFRIPFFVDLGFVGAMFMEIGILWKKHEKTIKKYTLPIAIFCAVYWLKHILRGDHLELWTRFYAGYEISIIEAIAGTFLVCLLAQMLEESAKKSKKFLKSITNSLKILGENTMLFYLIHCLDTSIFIFWDFRNGASSNEHLILTIIARITLNLALFIASYQALKLFKNRQKNGKIKA